METWDDMAKLCFQHLKPNDHTYVSGHLESYFKVSSKGNPKSSYKVPHLNYNSLLGYVI